ncbi:hypothetical protein [Saccharothrix australiensis]|uniref:Uncharacterized protein n=1 Tax=Saccharothrix australiensis TaxID=2072 RepID=A0A495VJ65_9PSEU|nr:hypothetical protein [Saccharothrix australiensis]RKT49356.1 hypothetical protein C8E97_6735 [Saccharothrix australiensis]
MAPRYLRATSGFMTADGVVVKAGQTVAADDLVVKGRAEFFQPLGEEIEAATRAPGERRVTPGRAAPDVVVMSAARSRRSRARQDKVKAEQQTARDETARQDAEQDTGDAQPGDAGEVRDDGGAGG